MTDDLVKKLRAGEFWKAESWTEKGNRYISVTYLNMLPGTIEEAAARIEELEAALDDIAQYVPRADINNLKHETVVALTWGKKDD